ncbi:hypothetical protein BDW62DRAFT_179588 [Aspergillus aurantiobrunneus]
MSTPIPTRILPALAVLQRPARNDRFLCFPTGRGPSHQPLQCSDPLFLSPGTGPRRPFISSPQRSNRPSDTLHLSPLSPGHHSHHILPDRAPGGFPFSNWNYPVRPRGWIQHPSQYCQKAPWKRCFIPLPIWSYSDSVGWRRGCWQCPQFHSHPVARRFHRSQLCPGSC